MFENSSSQIVFRTDIFPKIAVGCPSVVTRALEIIDGSTDTLYETMNDFEKKKTPYQDTRARMLMEAYSKI